MSKSIYCCECEYLTDIDKSQNSGYCDKFGGFHKLTAVCPYIDYEKDEGDKFQYSQEYLEIKQKAEVEWPQWKIDNYNNFFATSKHVQNIVHKEKIQ